MMHYGNGDMENSPAALIIIVIIITILIHRVRSECPQVLAVSIEFVVDASVV